MTGSIGRAADVARIGGVRPEFVDAFERAMTAAGGKLADIARHVGPLAVAAKRFDIVTRFRIAHFVAQLGHESGGFSRVEENLNYSADGLRDKFARVFKDGPPAEAYARRPEAIANLVYANVNGNGGEATGDGWRYRGRGLIQLTGRANYRRAGAALGIPLESEPDKAAEPWSAALIAGWFWADRDLNTRADIGAAGLEPITKRVNGTRMHGLEDRGARLRRAIVALAHFPDLLEV